MSDPPDLPSTERLTNADVDQDLPQTLAAPPRPYNRIGDTLWWTVSVHRSMINVLGEYCIHSRYLTPNPELPLPWSPQKFLYTLPLLQGIASWKPHVKYVMNIKVKHSTSHLLELITEHLWTPCLVWHAWTRHGRGFPHTKGDSTEALIRCSMDHYRYHFLVDNCMSSTELVSLSTSLVMKFILFSIQSPKI